MSGSKHIHDAPDGRVLTAETACEANTLMSLPSEHRHKTSGYISGPLVTAVSVKSPDVAPFAVAAEAASAPLEAPAQPAMPPQNESNPNKVPRTCSESPQLPPAASLTPLNATEPPSDPLLVLVVNDNAVMRALFSKFLTKLRCVVHTAKDGKECVDMVLGAEPHTYDLICLDNFMPVMTGEDAVKEIRANDRDDFIVGYTNNALTEDKDNYREAGVDE
ncbi:CheY-like superfamily, partial [Mycena galopus ATCC 62051]